MWLGDRTFAVSSVTQIMNTEREGSQPLSPTPVLLREGRGLWPLTRQGTVLLLPAACGVNGWECFVNDTVPHSSLPGTPLRACLGSWLGLGLSVQSALGSG